MPQKTKKQVKKTDKKKVKKVAKKAAAVKKAVKKATKKTECFPKTVGSSVTVSSDGAVTVQATEPLTVVGVEDTNADGSVAE